MTKTALHSMAEKAPATEDDPLPSTPLHRQSTVEARGFEVAVWRTRNPDHVRATLEEASIEHAVFDPNAGSTVISFGSSELVCVRPRDAIIAKSLLADDLIPINDCLQMVDDEFFHWHTPNTKECWSAAEAAITRFFASHLASLGSLENSFAWVEQAGKISLKNAGVDVFVSGFDDPETGDFTYVIRTRNVAIQGTVFPEGYSGFSSQIDDAVGSGLGAFARWLIAQTPEG